MNLSKYLKGAALFVGMIPFLGATCTDEKIIEIIVAAAIEFDFVAEGELNIHDDTGSYDVKVELDLEQVLADADIDPGDLDSDALKVSRIFYRITVAEAGRSIAGGNLTAARGMGPAQVVVSGFGFSAAAVTDWIDITGTLGAGGIDLLNGVIEDCLIELQGGPEAMDTTVFYTVSGNSIPGEDPTDFKWAVKIQFQGVLPKTFDILDF